MEDIEFTCSFCKIKFSRTENPRYFPFCSKRCQTLDLGAWVSEKYRVESKEPVSQETEDEE
jgi:endogenous inhibitor of DNA gyrase (YacG/DUF329 family)